MVTVWLPLWLVGPGAAFLPWQAVAAGVITLQCLCWSRRDSPGTAAGDVLLGKRKMPKLSVKKIAALPARELAGRALVWCFA